MRPRIHVITLAVSDLDRALEFYRDGLGLESAGVIGTEFAGDETSPAGSVAMFHLHGGLILALYPRTELAKDANVPFGPPKTGEFSIGHAVASKADVDALLAEAEAAGATVTDRPHDRPWGIYSGYFRDLDGHLWEILWNPQLEDIQSCIAPLDAHGIGHYFHHREVSGTHGLRKPDVRLFLRACDGLGISPVDCIMVGDRIDNAIVPAKLLGMRTVLFRTGRHRAQQPRSWEERPDVEAHDVAGLVRAIELLCSGP